MESGTIHKSLKQDQFEGVDFLDLDDLLTEEQKLIRSSIRDFVKKEISSECCLKFLFFFLCQLLDRAAITRR